LVFAEAVKTESQFCLVFSSEILKLYFKAFFKKFSILNAKALEMGLELGKLEDSGL
jgi:hypothetical protein